jgi:hypothetical protein
VKKPTKTDDMEKTLTERRRLAGYIQTHPERFVVCLGCDSILARSRVDKKDANGWGQGLCHYCASYRFDHDIAHICAQAQVNGEHESGMPEVCGSH